jgi:autotransporter-associated beta strand protein
LGVSAGTVTISDDDALAGAGMLVKAGAGRLTLGGTNANFAGRFAITGGTLGFDPAGSLSAQTAVSLATSGTFDLSDTTQTIGSLDGTGAVLLGSGTLNTGALNTSTSFDGVISGTGSITKIGTGTMTIGGANTYSGPTTIAAGTVTFAGAGSLSGQTAVNVLNGATLNVNGTTQTVGSLAGAGSVLLGTGALTVGGDNSATVFSGVVSGAGSLTKAGTGAMALAGANTFTGATTVAGGTLRFDVGGSLSGATAVSVLGGATLDLNDTAQTIGSLAGIGNVLLGSGALTTGTNNTSTNFAGVVSGTGAFDKAGSGTLTLAGFNTYTGPTTISGGTSKRCFYDQKKRSNQCAAHQKES